MKDYIPQIIMIALYAINLAANAANHGEPRNERYNFWTSLVATVISAFILKWGGFWS